MLHQIVLFQVHFFKKFPTSEGGCAPLRSWKFWKKTLPCVVQVRRSALRAPAHETSSSRHWNLCMLSSQFRTTKLALVKNSLIIQLTSKEGKKQLCTRLEGTDVSKGNTFL